MCVSSLKFIAVPDDYLWFHRFGLTSLLMWDDRRYPAVWVNIHYVNASSRSSWLRLSLCPVTEAADASKSRGIVFFFFFCREATLLTVNHGVKLSAGVAAVFIMA